MIIRMTNNELFEEARQMLQDSLDEGPPFVDEAYDICEKLQDWEAVNGDVPRWLDKLWLEFTMADQDYHVGRPY